MSVLRLFFVAFALSWLVVEPAAARQGPWPAAPCHAPDAAVDASWRSPPADAVDLAFNRVYNYDFEAALEIIDRQIRACPGRPLLHSVRAGTLLFQEMARLRILEVQFFLNDDNMVDGSRKPTPDPDLKRRLFESIGEARKNATAVLVTAPEDVEALFATCMSAAVEADYIGLIERRTWRSARLTRQTAKHAAKLLSLTPPVYDAYLDAGSIEYIVGSLPFFVRWFVRYEGIEGDKRRGIEQLKLTARHGRYYGPYARVLLTVAALREGKPEEAQPLLAELAEQFPENPLFRNELAAVNRLVEQKARRKR